MGHSVAQPVPAASLFQKALSLFLAGLEFLDLLPASILTTLVLLALLCPTSVTVAISIWIAHLSR